MRSSSHFFLLVCILLVNALWGASLGATTPPEQPDLSIYSTSPAKRDIERVIQSVEKTSDSPRSAATRLDAAQKKLERVKKKHPDLDLSPVQDYLSQMRTHTSTELAEIERQEALEKEFANVVSAIRAHAIHRNWTKDEALAHTTRTEQEIAAYLEAAHMAQAAKFTTLEQARRERTLKALDLDISGKLGMVDRSIETYRTLGPAESVYNQVNADAAYWRAVALVYPDRDDIARALAMHEAYMAEVGGKEGLRATIDKARAEAAARVTFPSQTLPRDNGVEKLFRRAFNAQKWDEDVLAVSQQTEWYTVRDASGKITGRTRDAYIGAKKKDDTCHLYHFTILQPFDGKDYTPEVRRKSHSTRAIACKNIPE